MKISRRPLKVGDLVRTRTVARTFGGWGGRGRVLFTDQIDEEGECLVTLDRLDGRSDVDDVPLSSNTAHFMNYELRRVKTGEVDLLDVVYFVQVIVPVPSSCFIKIGWTSNLESRLKSLRYSIPFDLRLLGIIEGGKELEGILHERFAKYRIRGEWFEPHLAVRAFINANRQAIPSLQGIN